MRFRLKDPVVARQDGFGDWIVVYPDGGRRYLSEETFQEHFAPVPAEAAEAPGIFERQYVELVEIFKDGIVLRPELLTLIDVQEKEREVTSMPVESSFGAPNSTEEKIVPDSIPDPSELAECVVDAVKLLNEAVTSAKGAGLVVEVKDIAGYLVNGPLRVGVLHRLW